MNLAPYIDHTLLKATATPADIVKLCAEAREHAFRAVCVNPQHVALARAELSGSDVLVATVCGFPLGAVTSEQKAVEARLSVEAGADEVDMVIAIGSALAGDWEYVQADIAAVRKAIPDTVLKVIIETCYLDENGKVRATEAAVAAGADFVKTSTGFGPGGATLEDVELMNRVIAGRAQIKAAGGVRTAEDAAAMIAAGATRLGTSGGVGLVSGGSNQQGY
ncbi:deoxyribose-phosphate aldolase [Deinococcus maricopensis]|uniref:Deoxyribose-phosphate aldolase n=1 Tax=Deinococcus maricopensis (strain DSM 21211 / LMG 22137 / NRRL B-23946 / LB-34) TaxID=709986 RepID=E8UAB9_DEIML|nr:deoxyribose-phosphate aldolase [Deinococcus maricopensis]ADV68008.1 Deoxyribose-phosphate aldolase [Deinococcus maricopensis DSM 21211]